MQPALHYILAYTYMINIGLNFMLACRMYIDALGYQLAIEIINIIYTEILHFVEGKSETIFVVYFC